MRSETLLLRQIHPNFVQAGRVISQAFRPTPKDEQRLSVDNGDLIEAKPAWTRFVSTPARHRAGVGCSRRLGLHEPSQVVSSLKELRCGISRHPMRDPGSESSQSFEAWENRLPEERRKPFHSLTQIVHDLGTMAVSCS